LKKGFFKDRTSDGAPHEKDESYNATVKSSPEVIVYQYLLTTNYSLTTDPIGIKGM